jgi:outer membrane protein assembly factor BamA
MKPFVFFFLSFILVAGMVSKSQNNVTPQYLLNISTADTLNKIDSKIKVEAILIDGNTKTKEYIILRELDFKSGDSINANSLYERCEKAKNLIYNTNLFSIVTVVPKLNPQLNLVVNIKVIERWYIYPLPEFKLNDRNFNEWFKTYQADFNRVTYGLNFSHNNLSGRADQLNFYLLNGYTRNYSLNYFAPNSNHNLNEGFSFGIGYQQNKEVIYKTSELNKLLLYRSSSFNRNSLFANISYRQRKGFYKKNIYFVQYNRIDVNDSIINSNYNPHYLNSPKSSIGFTDIAYTFQYVNVNNINYPLKGKMFSTTLSKRGLGISGGINMLSLDVKFRKFFTHQNHFYTSVQLLGKLKLPFEQPYINQKAMGYGEFYLNGLDYYVVDGVAAALSKFALRKKLISFNVPLPLKIKKIPFIPFSFYAASYVNAGVCYNTPAYQSMLNNKFLYTGGIGIDILSLYDMKLGIDYSFNQLGEKGLFLHASSIF